MNEFEVGILNALAVVGLEYKREKDNGDYYMNEVLPTVKGDYEALKANYEALEQQYNDLETKYLAVRDGLLELLAKEDK